MKIGFISMPFAGHLHPMTALARKLQSRGHEVMFFSFPDSERIVRSANLPFVSFCPQEYPEGSLAKELTPVATMYGLEIAQYINREVAPGLCSAAFRHLPKLLVEAGVEALVIDTGYSYVEFVPMSLRIPYVHIWNMLHFDMSGATPDCFFNSPPVRSPETLEIFAPLMKVAKSYARKSGLQIDWSDRASTFSRLAMITQTPREFDFPTFNFPTQFHYAGPFHDNEGREPIPFPWERLTGKPLVYASMGSLANGLERIYKSILQAAERFHGQQFVLSVGRHVNPGDLGPLPANTIVVRAAPQLELLKRAVLCITHAGLNTTLESLAQGVPMVAIPIGYDQPGVAARIAYHGVGEFLNLEDVTEKRLAALIWQVQEDPIYRYKAHYFQRVIVHTHGLDKAAEIVEQALGKTELASFPK